MTARSLFVQNQLDIQVRTLTVDDAKTIVSLWQLLEGRAEYGVKLLEAQLRQQFNCLYFGAFDQKNHPVGLVTLGWLGCHGKMLSLMVDPEYRRQKVATHLVNALWNRAVEQGLRHVDLEVALDNKAAMSLYEIIGFQPVHSSHATIQYRKACHSKPTSH